ncbi:MAG: glycoside hydrolase family 13 protein [Oscillibacter sp.]|nr:glycoside hydrolase family 13 protein [Oscillibacter sp.]
MSEPFVFDSRSIHCKDPFGAVPCGQNIILRCRPLQREGFTHCAVMMTNDYTGEKFKTELYPQAIDGERVRFYASFPAPDEPQLVWYYFKLWRDDGSGCDLDRTGYRNDGKQDPWQMTVYEKNHTPFWFGAGVTYQIFPDRFCRLEVPNPEGMIGNRWVHEDWNDKPVWNPPDGIWNRDFFGGSFKGITSKMDYLAGLGVSTIYFNPIFESASNHRYNTADYKNIDPMLGTEEDFREMCMEANRRGMRIILDGVFSHTGDQSRYFNVDGWYPELGAYQSKDSPYYEWYKFNKWPDDYTSWWGIHTLPDTLEENQSYQNYMIWNQDSVIRHWLRAGASGWRLDVADELPDSFIAHIRQVMHETASYAVLIGEVWEDASNKIAYSERRRYFLGKELHGVMNYPFRSATLDYLRGGDADQFRETLETLRENYPPAAFNSAMNFLGTHDTARILTVLGARHTPQSKEERAKFRLSPEERRRGLALVRLAAMILYAFPGSPTVYYGDECGMEGWEDPFNRETYPWGHEENDLQHHFAALGRIRHERVSLQRGSLDWLYTSGPILAFGRRKHAEYKGLVVNAGSEEREITIDWPGGSEATDLLTWQKFYVVSDKRLRLKIPPLSGYILG